MAEQVAGSICPKGYVVKSYGRRFLSRSKRWVKHRKNKAERAYVHPLEDLLKGGDWVSDVDFVFPAMYDKVTDNTVVTGEGMSYKALAEVAASVSA